MTGTATIEIHTKLRERLRSEPYASQVKVLWEEPFAKDTLLVMIESALLPAGHNGTMEIVIDPEGVRLKKWASTFWD